MKHAGFSYQNVLKTSDSKTMHIHRTRINGYLVATKQILKIGVGTMQH